MTISVVRQTNVIGPKHRSNNQHSTHFRVAYFSHSLPRASHGAIIVNVLQTLFILKGLYNNNHG
ncbi:hypothetical protein KEM09_21095, partial [Carboxylicivirga mesophila]